MTEFRSMKHDQPSLHVNGVETPVLLGAVAGYSRLSFQTACQIEHNAVHSTHSATSPEPTNVALFRGRQAPQAPQPVVGRWHGGASRGSNPSNHSKAGIAGASQEKNVNATACCASSLTACKRQSHSVQSSPSAAVVCCTIRNRAV